MIRTTRRQIPEVSSGPKAEDRPKTFRVRAVYAKTGLLRFLSHLDTGRVFQRAVARINTPIAYSQGFHPHPLISFGPALPVGTEGQNEYVDFYCTDQIDIAQFVRNMNATLPAGIHLHKADAIDVHAPSLSAHLTQFVYEITLPEVLVSQKPALTVEELTRTITHFHAQESWWITPFKKRVDGIDIKPFVDAFDVHPDDSQHPQIHLALTVRENITLKPEEVLHLVLHISYEQVLDCRIVRIMCS